MEIVHNRVTSSEPIESKSCILQPSPHLTPGEHLLDVFCDPRLVPGLSDVTGQHAGDLKHPLLLGLLHCNVLCWAVMYYAEV